MATNPNNAVGTNGAYGGRTSVNAFNDVLSAFNGRGIVQGWDLAPNSGMTIAIGGDGETRDVAIAEDNIGNKTTVNNISGQPIEVTISAAPATNSRIDLVVAYVDNPAQGSSTETDNPGPCGLIVVSGSAASSPTAPDESVIRTAITADGGAGTVAYYVVLGQVTVASGTTDISADMLAKGSYAGITSQNVDWTTYDAGDIFEPSAVGTVSGKLSRLGNVLTGTMTFTRSSGTFGNFDSYIGAFKPGFRPKWGVVTSAFMFSGATSSATSTTGYAVIQPGGGLSVRNPNSNDTSLARFILSFEI